MNDSWLVLLARLAGKLDLLDDLIEAVNGVALAEGIDAKASALGRALLVLGTILSGSAALSFADEQTAVAHFQSVDVQRFGDGKLLERLRKFAEGPLGKLLIEYLIGKIGI